MSHPEQRNAAAHGAERIDDDAELTDRELDARAQRTSACPCPRWCHCHDDTTAE